MNFTGSSHRRNVNMGAQPLLGSGNFLSRSRLQQQQRNEQRKANAAAKVIQSYVIRYLDLRAAAAQFQNELQNATKLDHDYAIRFRYLSRWKPANLLDSLERIMGSDTIRSEKATIKEKESSVPKSKSSLPVINQPNESRNLSINQPNQPDQTINQADQSINLPNQPDQSTINQPDKTINLPNQSINLPNQSPDQLTINQADQSTNQPDQTINQAPDETNSSQTQQSPQFNFLKSPQINFKSPQISLKSHEKSPHINPHASISIIVSSLARLISQKTLPRIVSIMDAILDRYSPSRDSLSSLGQAVAPFTNSEAAFRLLCRSAPQEVPLVIARGSSVFSAAQVEEIWDDSKVDELSPGQLVGVLASYLKRKNDEIGEGFLRVVISLLARMYLPVVESEGGVSRVGDVILVGPDVWEVLRGLYGEKVIDKISAASIEAAEILSSENSEDSEASASEASNDIEMTDAYETNASNSEILEAEASKISNHFEMTDAPKISNIETNPSSEILEAEASKTSNVEANPSCEILEAEASKTSNVETNPSSEILEADASKISNPSSEILEAKASKISAISSLFLFDPPSRNTLCLRLTLQKVQGPLFHAISSSPAYVSHEGDGIFWKNVRAFCELFSFWMTISLDMELWEGGVTKPDLVSFSSFLRAVCLSNSFDLDTKRVMTTLLRQIYLRNLGLGFLQPSFWKGLVDSSKEKERNEILENMPFFIDFKDRVKHFQDAIGTERSSVLPFFVGESEIRRGRVFLDAFEAFDKSGPGFRNPIKVVFVNENGREAGIDGGGMTKECLSAALSEAFHPSFGLFRETESHELYPDPQIALKALQGMEESEQVLRYLGFVGKLVGKCIFEGVLVDFSFSPFFLKRWNSRNPRSSASDLKYLDAELSRSLLQLLKMSLQELADLDLSFSIDEMVGGVPKRFDLLPGGAKKAVTPENRLLYIELVAGFKLNRALHVQCRAFLHGLNQIVPLELLDVFDYLELQMLISGENSGVDVDDWRKNVCYGGYLETDTTVRYFWEVVEEFSPEERARLLKFVTSVPKPPLLGFAQMVPAFGIRNAGGDVSRFPTASTCANLLKFPDYRDKELVRERLLYVIYAEAGFDLS